MPASNEEKAAVYAAMAHDSRGTGHWYYSENGHPFTIGEVWCANNQNAMTLYHSQKWKDISGPLLARREIRVEI
jgi:hypothetical protein